MLQGAPRQESSLATSCTKRHWLADTFLPSDESAWLYGQRFWVVGYFENGVRKSGMSWFTNSSTILEGLR